MVLGIALSTSLGRSERLELSAGQTVRSLGYALTYQGDDHTPQGGRVLRVAIEAPRWRLDARPVLLPSPRDQGVFRKPAISGAREIYLAPVEVREPGPGDAGVTWLDKGSPLEVGGARYTFTGFRMESGAEFMAYADLEVAKEGRTWKVSPAISAGPSGTRAVPADVPSVGSVSLERMDADRGRVALSLPVVAAAGVAIVDLSTKPFINLVWIGVLAAFLGTVLAGLRRAAEKAPPRRDRPVASGPQALLRAQTPKGREHVMHTASSNPGARRGGGALLSALLALAFSTAPVAEAAENAPAPADTAKPVMFLKETVVTGSRYPRAYYESPQALSFVTRSQLRELQPTVVGDVLSSLPGVDNSKDSPWEQRPVLRGLAGQRVLVLMDGSPMNSARGNGPHPSLVDPAQVERIEVVRGPSSVAYGSDALGGAINIITREASLSSGGRSIAGSASLGGSSVDQQRTGYLEVIPRIGNFSAFLSSGARKAEEFEAPSGTVTNSQFKDYNALLNLRYDFTGKTALKTGYQVYRGSDIGLPGLDIRVPGETDAFSFPFYERDLAHLTLDHGYRDSWLAGTRAKVYWQREHRSFFSEHEVARSNFYTDPYLGLNPGFAPAPGAAQSVYQRQDRYFQLETWGGQLQATSIQTRAYRLTAGLDAARDKTDGDNVRFRTYYDASGNPLPGPGGSNPTSVRTTASVPDGRFDNYGGYAQGEWYLHPRWTMSAGGRYTHYRYRTDYGLNTPAAGPSPPVYFQPKSVDDDALSGSLGMVYEPVQDLHVTANVANGYRQPNAQDLFFNGPGSVGLVLGNENLKPERSVSYDLGMRWGPGAFAVSGNVFYTTFNDLINAIPVAPGTYRYTNIATANTWGGELEAQWRFRPQWLARTAMSGTVGNVTSQEAIQQIYGLNADQVPLEQVPPYRGNASLRWTESEGRWWLESTARWSWRTNRLPPPIPGVGQLSTFKAEWLVGDVFAGARFGGQRVLVGLRNFTNTPYRQALGSIQEPGLSFVGSISADF